MEEVLTSSLGELYQGAVDVINEGIDVTPLKSCSACDIRRSREKLLDRLRTCDFDLTDVRPEMLFH